MVGKIEGIEHTKEGHDSTQDTGRHPFAWTVDRAPQPSPYGEVHLTPTDKKIIEAIIALAKPDSDNDPNGSDDLVELKPDNRIEY